MLWVTREAPSNKHAKRDTNYYQGEIAELRNLFLKFQVPYTDLGSKLEVGNHHFASSYEVALKLGVEISLDKKTQTSVSKMILPPQPKEVENVTYPSFKLNPFHEQKEALIYGLEKEQFLLADTPGSGKSFTAVMLAEYLKAHYGFKHALIICGVSSNQRNWAKEIPQYSTQKHRILGARRVNTGKPTERLVVTGNKDRVSDLQGDMDEFYLITNIHSLQDENVAKELIRLVQDGSIGYVIVDEIHLCTSTVSKQGKNLEKIKSHFRVGMSGTPFNTPEDLYPIATWLGKTYSGKEDYLTQYGDFETTHAMRNMAKSKGMRFAPTEYVLKNIPKFKYDLDRYMLRRDKATQDLDIPAFQDIFVELGKEQRALYDKAVEDNNLFTANILSLSSLAQQEEENQSSKYHPARKVLSIPKAVGGTEDAKLEVVKELLEKHLKNGEKVIVFTFYREAVRQYEKELSKKFKKGLFISDETKDVDGEIEAFKDGNYDYIVGGVKRIGTGHNLQQANIVIFADRPETWNVYEQNFKRAWRVGQTKKVVVYKLIAPDTWDDSISFNLQEQKMLSDAILGATIVSENVIDSREDLDKR